MRAPIRLVVAAMLTLFSISVVSILLTHRATDEAEILSTMRSIQRNVSDATVERTDTFLLEAGEEAQLAVRLLESGTIEKGAGLEDYFAGVLQTSPELSGIFYGTESGEFLFVNRTDEVSPNGFRTKAITVDAGSRVVDLTFHDEDFRFRTSQLNVEDTYDPRVRPWYGAAVAAAGEMIITDPYVFFSSQEPGVTAALPVLGSDGEVQGVVGVDVSLTQLSDFLVELRLGKNGSAFIVNRTGEVIALEDQTELRQPDGAGFRLSTVSEIEDPVVARTFNHGIASGLAFASRFFALENGGTTAHISVTPIGSSDWVLGVALSESDFVGAVRQDQRNSSLIVGGIGILSVFLAWLLIRNVTQPLLELRQRASDIENGLLERQPPVKTRITEVQQTSEAFEHMADGLRVTQDRLKTQALDLQHHAEQLERSNSELAQFAFAASHDLQEPLRSIGSYSSLLSRKYESEIDDEGRRWLGYISDGAQHLSDLLRELLGYAAVDDGVGALEPFALDDALTAALNDLAGSIEEADAEIVRQPLPVVSGNHFQMERLFLNLVGNAIKYRSESGTPRVWIGFTESDQECRISVRDNGIGIKPEYHQRIFEIFRRVGPRSKYDGTGIGLAACQKIVVGHGGSMGVESSPGNGSEFWFTLPRIAGQPSQIDLRTREFART